jgi:transglutaminase-like putative cysteine protease
MKHHIIHDTIFHYDHPVSESIMEVRLHPRDDERQRCERFVLTSTPKAPIHGFVDAIGNHVHHFNIPNPLTTLIVRANTVVEVWAPPILPDALPMSSWEQLQPAHYQDRLDMVLPNDIHGAAPD